MGKISFTLGKVELWTNYEFRAYSRTFVLINGPEQKYKLSDVLHNQAACEMKTLQVQVYVQQWFMKGNELNLFKF